MFGGLTLDLDVPEQHGFDHLPSHQYPGCSPVQDVCAGLQAHLGGEEKQKSTEGSEHLFSRGGAKYSLCASPSLHYW